MNTTLQVMALLTGCYKTAAAVNLVNTGKREDIYQLVADRMAEILGKEIPRKPQVKYSLMTHLYGSEAVPRNYFGKNTSELKAFYQALQGIMPGAERLRKIFDKIQDPKATEYSWVMPDGHSVIIPVLDTVLKRLEIDELSHKKFSWQQKCVSAKKVDRSIGANICHAIDSYIMRKMIRKATFPMACIHDQFWSSLPYVGQIPQLYRECLAEVHQENLLASILVQLGYEEAIAFKPENDLSQEILQSQYALS